MQHFGEFRLMARRVMLIAGVAGGALLAVGAPAAWAFQASVTSSPATIAYYGRMDPRTTRSIEYRVTLTAGTDPETVVIDVSKLDRPVIVAGPATLTELSRIHGDPPSAQRVPGPDACSYPTPDFLSWARYELMLPAGSTSAIAFTRPLQLDSALLSASPFVSSFTIAPAPPGDPRGGGSPLAGEVKISSPTPNLAGLKPSQLDLRAGLAGSGTAVRGATSLNVRRGSRVRISGTLKPARRGDHITIWDYAPGATVPQQLAIVNVDRNGRYQYLRWRPTTVGLWGLYATWPGRDGKIEPARSACGGPHIVVTTGARTLPTATSGLR